MKIAMIGFGTVGQGLAQILRDKADELCERYGFSAKIVAVYTRSRGSLVHPHGLDPAALLQAIAGGSLDQYPEQDRLERGWDALRIARESNADVLVEVSPTNLETGQPALDICRAALESGRHIVLANKGPVAVAYRELALKAEAAGRAFLFEGTVMAGTPSLRLAREALAGCTISEVRGIINGTTNYILTQMETGMGYSEALQQAQAIGYAEADPTADVDGWDAAGKAIILAQALFGVRFTFDQMSVRGISHLTAQDIADAKAAGERWKLIARVTPESASVQPQRIPVTHPLAGVSGGTNALTFTTDLMGEITLIGAGAGGIQTGFGVLSDLLAIYRQVRS